MFKDRFELVFESKSENESFARVAVASFAARLNPTLEEIDDIKTAVSEAVTNAIIHGYNNMEGFRIFLECEIDLKEKNLTITIKDEGVGIEDIKKAREPLYTTKPDLDRSGMGFVFMEVFMDQVIVESKIGCGTKIILKKKINSLDIIL